jgi:2-beta-glucuronyltransferase
MKIFFLTGHIAGAPRKATANLLAEAYAALGHDVRIVTNGYSLVTILKGDARHVYAKELPKDHWFDAGERIKGYIPRMWINPGRFPIAWLNRLTTPFFNRYASRLSEAVMKEMYGADLIFIESGAGLLYAATIKNRWPEKKLVYLYSDRLSTLRVHPVLQTAQDQGLSLFSLIVCPAQSMVKDFVHPQCHYVPQGVDTHLLDAPTQTPYSKPHNIVSVGDMLFDEEAVMMLARYAPDWTIHLFGKGAQCSQKMANIVEHGEKPFCDIIPYIQHADIGLAPYRPLEGAEYLSQSSLKMMQYRYARLPIIAPVFATNGHAHTLAYIPGDSASIGLALENASSYDRSTISTADILSWERVAKHILELATGI